MGANDVDQRCSDIEAVNMNYMQSIGTTNASERASRGTRTVNGTLKGDLRLRLACRLADELRLLDGSLT